MCHKEAGERGKKDAGVDLVPRAITYIFFHFHLKYRWELLCRRERIDNYVGDQKFAGISEGCWHPRGVPRGGGPSGPGPPFLSEFFFLVKSSLE